MEEFLKLFSFRQEGAWQVGVERECYLTNNGAIKPLSPLVLAHLAKDGRFGYELSACQLEDRVGPCQLADLKNQLLQNEEDIKTAEKALCFQRLFLEVAPIDMPLDVFPDPTGRYQQIVKTMPQEVLLAACRVTGTHIHIGMPDHETALKVYNQVIAHWQELCQLGDGSQGQRLEIYKIVAPAPQPLPYADWADFHQKAIERKFDHDPRSCWTLIRISVHGTIEFRMFGPTRDLDKLVSWAQKCHQLCQQALKA